MTAVGLTLAFALLMGAFALSVSSVTLDSLTPWQRFAVFVIDVMAAIAVGTGLACLAVVGYAMVVLAVG